VSRRQNSRVVWPTLQDENLSRPRPEKIKLGDVDPVIQFTRELMSAHLG
jgi:hypothetical protein